MTLAPGAGRDDPLACVPPFRGKLTDPRVGIAEQLALVVCLSIEILVQHQKHEL